jgi:hypothetical protein
VHACVARACMTPMTSSTRMFAVHDIQHAPRERMHDIQHAPRERMHDIQHAQA